MENDLGRS